MATVGEITVYRSANQAFRVWIEYEVTAVDGDPDDPQATQVKPLRFAYQILDPAREPSFPGVGRLKQLGTVTTDHTAPVWNDVPAQFSKTRDDITIVNEAV